MLREWWADAIISLSFVVVAPVITSAICLQKVCSMADKSAGFRQRKRADSACRTRLCGCQMLTLASLGQVGDPFRGRDNLDFWS